MLGTTAHSSVLAGCRATAAGRGCEGGAGEGEVREGWLARAFRQTSAVLKERACNERKRICNANERAVHAGIETGGCLGRREHDVA